MKYAVLACTLALGGCSAQAEDTSAYLAQRDETMAKLMDKNTDLENRVAALEARVKLQSAAAADDRKNAELDRIAADKKQIVDEIINDKRLRDLEAQ